ncbi:hypothetical protein YWS52_25280 [Chitiniphilus shinanonensis]
MGGEAGERGIEQAGAHVLIGGAGRPATGAGRWGGGHPLKLINDLINFKGAYRRSAVARGESGGKGAPAGRRSVHRRGARLDQADQTPSS